MEISAERSLIALFQTLHPFVHTCTCVSAVFQFFVYIQTGFLGTKSSNLDRNEDIEPYYAVYSFFLLESATAFEPFLCLCFYLDVYFSKKEERLPEP